MRLFLLWIFISGYAMGAVTIKGVIENGSGDGEGQADQLILMTLTGGMKTVAHLEDVKGSFEIEFDGEFEPGQLLLQAMKGPVFYSTRIQDINQPLNIKVYDNAEEVTLNARLGSLALYAYEDKLDIGLFFNLDNVSDPPKTLLREEPVFSFPLIPGSQGLDANTLRGSMPLKQNLIIGEDKASLAYALKPGRTQLMVRSIHSYDASKVNEYSIPLLDDQEVAHVLLMPMNMEVSGLGLESAGVDEKQGVKLFEWSRQEGQKTLDIKVSGTPAPTAGDRGGESSTATTTAAADNTAAQANHGKAEILNTPNMLGKYRWQIVLGVLAIFGFLTGLSFRKA